MTFNLWQRVVMKLNRIQPIIHQEEGSNLQPTTAKRIFDLAYDRIEVCRRGVDLLVDSGAEIAVSIMEKIPMMKPQTINSTSGNIELIRKKRLELLLNFLPNEDNNVNEFRRGLLMDLVITGNCFQYFDGSQLYQLPAREVEIITGKKRPVEAYEYSGVTFKPNEVIHTKDNSATSVLKGESRLTSAVGSIDTLYRMLTFQNNFFKNGAYPGLILSTPNVLSIKIKDRILAQWRRKYNANNTRSPMILDGDFKVSTLSNQTFQDLDFAKSVETHELKILKALGVPTLLLQAGNNANISPNLKLFYQTSVLSLVRKINSSYERYFGYDIKPDISEVMAMQPELQDQANFYTSLVNGGIITINEARIDLRREESDEEHADKLRIPANIAGSAVDPSQGGAPEKPDDDEEDEDQE